MSTVTQSVSRSSQRRFATAVVLGCLAITAWAASVNEMSGTEMSGRFSVCSFGFFVGLWVIMMSAMMFPSVWPAVSVYGLVIRRRADAEGRMISRSAMFVAGYLASWTAVGLVAFGVLAAARTAGLDTLSDAQVARLVVAPVAFAGALYQATPLKRACLRHCRGPLSFFMEHWRQGPRGALTMGARHGAYCVGCCWMLMLVLLALGVMSITWMVVVSLAIAVEKLAPMRWPRLASGLLATGLVVLALVALVKPAWLPGVGSGMGEMDGTKEMLK